MSMKNEFIKWFSPKAPESYKSWFGDNLDGKLNDINEAYKTSFGKSVFDIDINNIENEIDTIEKNLKNKNKNSVTNKTFTEYNDRNSSGIPNAILTHYIRFLKVYNNQNNLDKINEPVSEDNNQKKYFSPDSGILYVVFNKWIRDPDTNEMPYKIGITRVSVEDRYYGLGLKMPGKFETLFAYKFDNCTKTEQTIHSILNKKRENGEWFSINEKLLEHIRETCEIMEGKLVTDEIENEIISETGEDIEIEIKTKNKLENNFELKYDNDSNVVDCITGKDILNMEVGDTISNLYMLIVNSKDPNSKNWAGKEYIIHNTPQKGINWIGDFNKPLAVIIKTKEGKYKEDGDGKYAFEATKGYVNKNQKSNQVLINQRKNNYPILYFTQNGPKYTLTGKFSVDKEFDDYVTLVPFESKN